MGWRRNSAYLIGAFELATAVGTGILWYLARHKMGVYRHFVYLNGLIPACYPVFAIGAMFSLVALSTLWMSWRRGNRPFGAAILLASAIAYALSASPSFSRTYYLELITAMLLIALEFARSVIWPNARKKPS